MTEIKLDCLMIVISNREYGILHFDGNRVPVHPWAHKKFSVPVTRDTIVYTIF